MNYKKELKRQINLYFFKHELFDLMSQFEDALNQVKLLLEHVHSNIEYLCKVEVDNQIILIDKLTCLKLKAVSGRRNRAKKYSKLRKLMQLGDNAGLTEEIGKSPSLFDIFEKDEDLIYSVKELTNTPSAARFKNSLKTLDMLMCEDWHQLYAIVTEINQYLNKLKNNEAEKIST